MRSIMITARRARLKLEARGNCWAWKPRELCSVFEFMSIRKYTECGLLIVFNFWQFNAGAMWKFWFFFFLIPMMDGSRNKAYAFVEIESGDEKTNRRRLHDVMWRAIGWHMDGFWLFVYPKPPFVFMAILNCGCRLWAGAVDGNWSIGSYTYGWV